MSKEAMKLALEALLWANDEINAWRNDAHGYKPEDQPVIMSAVTAMRVALAEQPAQQEPLSDELLADCVPEGAWIVEHEGKRKRVSMTRQQLHEFVTRAIKAAHGIKENT